MVAKQLKLTPWEIFNRYKVGPDYLHSIGPAKRESLSVVFDSYNMTQSSCDEVLRKLHKELLRRINRDLYKLLKRSLQGITPSYPKDNEERSRVYVQFGHMKVYGGMFIGVVDEPTMVLLDNKLTVYVTYKAYIDPKEIRQLR